MDDATQSHLEVIAELEQQHAAAVARLDRHYLVHRSTDESPVPLTGERLAVLDRRLRAQQLRNQIVAAEVRCRILEVRIAGGAELTRAGTDHPAVGRLVPWNATGEYAVLDAEIRDIDREIADCQRRVAAYRAELDAAVADFAGWCAERQ